MGTGDGRIVIAPARAGAIASGYEPNPLLVFRSRLLIKKEGLIGKVFVYWKSFLKVDLSEFDVVCVYGIGYIMAKLEKKLKRELKTGARMASFSFKFPTWKPIKKENIIYLYKR